VILRHYDASFLFYVVRKGFFAGKPLCTSGLVIFGGITVKNNILSTPYVYQ
jgi:hypothetical protein